jgi:hypothetical protein
MLRSTGRKRAPIQYVRSTHRFEPPLFVPLDLIELPGPSQHCQANHLVSDDRPAMPRIIFVRLGCREGGEDAEWDVVQGKVRVGRDGDEGG